MLIQRCARNKPPNPLLEELCPKTLQAERNRNKIRNNDEMNVHALLTIKGGRESSAAKYP